MRIKGVIFDKDGTLIEFSDMWRRSLEEFFDKYSLEEDIKVEIRNKIGIAKDFSVVENSILAAGTMGDLVDVMKDYFPQEKNELHKEIGEHFLCYMEKHPDMIIPTCDLKSLFEELTAREIKIGVITADDYHQAKLCLKILGLDRYIQFLATGDRYLNKPNPESLDAFCEKFSISRKEVAIVGDSDIDMILGKKAGLSIGVLSGVGSEKMLKEYADFVIKSPCEVPSILL